MKRVNEKSRDRDFGEPLDAYWNELPSHIHNPPSEAVNNLTGEHAWPFAAPLLFLVVLLSALVASCWFATRPSIQPVPKSEITYAKDGGP